MLRPHHVVLLVSLLADGGTAPPPPAPREADAGIHTVPDAGVPDAGAVASKPKVINGVRWPEEVRPLATLDGRAILAAHAAMQSLLARIAKQEPKYAGDCDHSPKAMDVSVGEGGGMYLVRINRRVDRCGWADPSFNAAVDWFELYAVSPEGQVLARYPPPQE
jgi:hypothetical protein